MITPQLPLALHPPASRSFDTFWPGPNGEAFEVVREASATPGRRWVALSGPSGSGKSHLLAAAARRAAGGVLIGGDELRRVAVPDEIVELAGPPLLCIDDLDALLGDAAWEEALYALLDRVRRGGQGLVFSARTGPRTLSPALPDLASRLTWGVHCRLVPLDDDDKAALLRARARQRGFEIDDRTIRYLLTRLPRDLTVLTGWIDHLVDAGAAARRRISPRLVRDLLDASGTAV